MSRKTQHIDGACTEVSQEVQCCMSLWMHVLLRAISDLRGNGVIEHNNTKESFAEQRGRMRGDARVYLASEDRGVGSFEWICALVGIDAERARERLLEPRPHRRKHRPQEEEPMEQVMAKARTLLRHTRMHRT